MGTWISIVTVLKDDDLGFAHTFASLLAQDLAGVEYIVIDGSMHSNRVISTLESSSACESRYFWQEPRGIYEAMNFGLEEATGDYTFFLNAGDPLTQGALDSVHELLRREQPLWCVGEVRFIDQRGSKVTPTPLNYVEAKRAMFSNGRFPPHQGTFVQTEVLRALGGFNQNFRIAADYEMALRLSTIADPIMCPEVVAEFSVGGLSSIAWRDSLREFHLARRQVLMPSGFSSVREHANTGVQFAKLWLTNRFQR